MNADEIVRALRKAQEDYKNDFVSFGRIRIDEMARDCADMIESLQAQLTESQRRERAAVEDLKRTPGIWPCFACKHAGQMSIRCRPDSRDCFEWRGPQEAGKGEKG